MTLPMTSTGRVGQDARVIRGEQNGLEQVFDPGALLGRDGHDHGIAAPVVRRQAKFGELLFYAVRVGVRFVDLVERDDDRDCGRFGVGVGLARLRHHPVVRGHDQDDDVGDLRAAGAHGGEGRVPGRVEEGDQPLLVQHLIGADVLRDAAGLAAGHVGAADGVEQGGFAVVDVPENGRPPAGAE